MSGIIGTDQGMKSGVIGNNINPGRFVGHSYGQGKGDDGKWVTVENNKDYYCTLQMSHSAQPMWYRGVEKWTVSVNGSGVCSPTEHSPSWAGAISVGVGTNTIRIDTTEDSSGTYRDIDMLVFEMDSNIDYS